MGSSKKKKKVEDKELMPVHTVIYEGDEYQLAVVQKGKDLPDEEKIKIAELVCQMYSTDRYTILSCLKHCGVNSENTWHLWRTRVAQIGEMYKTAQEIKGAVYSTRLVERARTQMERMIEGYKMELEEKLGEVYTDKEGNEFIRTKAIRVKEIYVRPNERLIQFALTNRDSKFFTKSIEPERGNDDLIPNEIKITIEGGEVDPVTDEDDIQDIEDDRS